MTAGTSSAALPEGTGRLGHDVAWMILGNVIYALSTGGMLVVLAQLGDPEVVGEFTWAVALTMPFILLSRLSLREVLATDADNRFWLRDYLVASGAATLFAITAIWVVVALVYSSGRLVLVMFVALGKVLESFSFLLYGLRQQHGQIRRVGISVTLRGITQVVALTVGMAVTGSLLWGVGAAAIASGLMLFGVDVPGVWKLVPSSDSRKPKLGPAGRLILLTLPLGAGAVLLTSYQSLPRLMLERVAGTFELGVFGVMGWVAIGAATVVHAAGQAAAPRMGRQFAAGDGAALRGLLQRLLVFSGAFGLMSVGFALVCGRWFLGVAFGAEYAAHSGLLVLTMVSSGVAGMAIPLEFVLIAVRRVWAYSLSASVLVVTAVVAGIALIPRFGMAGAAWVLIAASCVRLIVSGLMVRSTVGGLLIGQKSSDGEEAR